MKEVLYIKVSRLPQLFFGAPLETRNRNTFHSTAVSWLTVTELDTNIGNYYGHFGVVDTNLMVHKHVGMPADGIREPPSATANGNECRKLLCEKYQTRFDGCPPCAIPRHVLQCMCSPIYNEKISGLVQWAGPWSMCSIPAAKISDSNTADTAMWRGPD